MVNSAIKSYTGQQNHRQQMKKTGPYQNKKRLRIKVHQYQDSEETTHRMGENTGQSRI